MTRKKIRLTMEADGPSYRVNRDEMALAVRTYRIRTGRTQKQLGTLFGVSRYTIMAVEAGREVHWTTAYKIFASLSDALKQEGGNV